MKKLEIPPKKIIIILVILNIIVLLAIVAVIYYNTLQKRQFNYSLNKCDLNIFRDAYDAAETILVNILPYAAAKSDYLRILKRANLIADKTGKYQNFVFISEKAFNKFKKNEAIFTLYIYSLIKNSDFTKAVSMVDNNKKLIMPESLSYVIYAMKYKQSKNPDILPLIKNNDVRKILEGNPDLTIYEQLYSKSEKPAVLNNYLLSVLLAGDYKKASDILDQSKYKYEIDNELSGLIFYDNKNFFKARDLFYKSYERKDKEIVDIGILMLLADTFIQTDSYKEAYDLYDIIIFNDKNFSWIPYVNKDWINMVLGKKSSHIEEALNIFHNEKELAFLSILKNQHYETKDTKKNQDKYISEFWEYYAENNMTDEFKIFFVKELYRMGRFDEISLFTKKLDNQDKEWALFFNALTSFSKKEYDNALILFQKYYEITGSWRGIYNIGIIQLLNSKYEYAANYFSNIINSALKNNIYINDNDLADIYLMLSLSLTMNGDYSKGEFYINKALLIGNNSIIAIYLQNYYKSK